LDFSQGHLRVLEQQTFVNSQHDLLLALMRV
jgi:hypothetical protein